MAYWLVKSEPKAYSWDQFVKEKTTSWDGIRNHAARLHLLAMQLGEKVFYYHSNEGLEIVGTAELTKLAYPDPTAEEIRWVSVELKALAPLPKPVSLSLMKSTKGLENMALIRISRLSVSPVSNAEWEIIMQLANN